MSLINDALRRVQAVQRARENSDHPAGVDWQLAPVPRPGPAPWILLASGMCLGAGLILVGFWWREHAREQPPAAAATAGAAEVIHGLALQSDPAPALPQTEASGVGVGPARADKPVGLANPPSPVAAALSDRSAASEPPSPTPTPAHSPTGQPEPSPSDPLTGPVPLAVPDLKLQGLIYHPERPVAVLNHRSVGPGETVQGWTVVRIEPRCVIVTGYGRTNVLELP